MVYIGAAATAVLFILQIAGIISVSGWLIAAPLLLSLAYVLFVWIVIGVIALIANK